MYELLTARNQKPAKGDTGSESRRVRQADEAYFAAAAKASRCLLGPAASQIENKRLLIVGEGVLQYLPFAALPEPGTGDRRQAASVNREVTRSSPPRRHP